MKKKSKEHRAEGKVPGRGKTDEDALAILNQKELQCVERRQTIDNPAMLNKHDIVEAMLEYAGVVMVDEIVDNEALDKRTRRIIQDQESIIECTTQRLKNTQAALAKARKLHAQASQLLAAAGRSGQVTHYNQAIQKLVDLGKLLQNAPDEMTIKN